MCPISEKAGRKGAAVASAGLHRATCGCRALVIVMFGLNERVGGTRFGDLRMQPEGAIVRSCFRFQLMEGRRCMRQVFRVKTRPRTTARESTLALAVQPLGDALF